MDINSTMTSGNFTQNVNSTRTQGAYAANGTQAPAATSQATGDTVQLSQEGVLRQEAYNVAMATSDVRQDRVSALKEQVQNGTYQVNSRELAGNLVRDEAAFSAVS